MQPRNPFMGQPPSNMQFPMQEYIQGAANAANTVAQGQAQMGKSIAEGLSKAASAISGAYTQSQTEKKDFSANMAMLESPTYQKILGIDEFAAGDLKKKFSEMQNTAGYSAANKQFSQLVDPLMKFFMLSKELEAKQKIAETQTGTQLKIAGMPARSSGNTEGTQPTINVESARKMFKDIGFGN